MSSRKYVEQGRHENGALSWPGWEIRETGKSPDDLENLRRLGFRLEETVKCPPGWTLTEAGENSSDLYDDQGRGRGFVYIKQEVYQKRAFVTLRSRFHLFVCAKSPSDDRVETLGIIFNDHASADDRPGSAADLRVGSVISDYEFNHGVNARGMGEYKYVSAEYRALHKETYAMRDAFKKKLEEAANALFAKIFPAHKDPLAYWDTDVSAQKAELKHRLTEIIDSIQPQTLHALVPKTKAN